MPESDQGLIRLSRLIAELRRPIAGSGDDGPSQQDALRAIYRVDQELGRMVRTAKSGAAAERTALTPLQLKINELTIHVKRGSRSDSLAALDRVEAAFRALSEGSR